ncbi:MAG TPA: GNAT family N-acetyltransferase [Myxococcota bacterium]|nr:GNAT family N-acetyltransferase [Myxococcota bacterium]
MRIRELQREEIPGLFTIDRAELVETVFVRKGNELVLKRERHELSGWPAGEVDGSRQMLLDCFDHGGAVQAAFESETLVGASALDARFMGRDHAQLQLKFLHVSRGWRGRGVGAALFEAAARRARELGARRLYVSATPSENTIRFYLGRGCRVTEDVDAEQLALEPEDIHLEYAL